MMSRVAEQMENHPVHQVEDPDSVARISKEIIALEEQVLQVNSVPSVDGLACSRVLAGVCVYFCFAASSMLARVPVCALAGTTRTGRFPLRVVQAAVGVAADRCHC